jgi:hypothetical protein
VALLWRQPLVTFPPRAPFPLPPHPSATRTIRSQRRIWKIFPNHSPRSFPALARTRVFRLFQSIILNSSAWRRVTTKLPVRENFLLEAVVTMCCKCPLLSTRSPGAIADLRAAMYRTTLRVLGVSRLVNRLIALTQSFYAGVTFCPSFGGEGPQMSPPSRSCPEMAFPDLQAVSCLSPPILGANERLMPKGVFIALIALPLNFAFHR